MTERDRESEKESESQPIRVKVINSRGESYLNVTVVSFTKNNYSDRCDDYASLLGVPSEIIFNYPFRDLISKSLQGSVFVTSGNEFTIGI